MKAIIVNPIRKKDTNANVLVKQFYQECMNETKIDSDQNHAFLKAIKDLGGWPLLEGPSWNDSSFDWIDWNVKARNLGLPIREFFSLTRVESSENDTVLQVSGTSLNLEIDLDKDKYNRAMKKIIEALGGTHFQESENEKVIEFLEKLKKFATKEQDAEVVGDMTDLADECPFVPWTKLLNSFSVNQTSFNESSEVALGKLKSYCKSLSKLINSTEPRTIANYYVWSIIDQSNKFLSRDIRDAYADIKNKNVARYKMCFAEADRRFKYVKETIYVRKKTPKIVKEQLKEMIELMKNVFIEHLKVCDWMDATTKLAAIEKTQLIESVIGGDPELYDVEYFDKILGVDGFKFTSDNMFEMSRQKRIRENQYFFKTLYGPIGENWPSFFKNAVQLNAFFVQALNIMILPAPILSSIFYDHRMPAFMNYGSIGRVIGHEIMHGFEKSGRKVILENDATKDWWTNATADNYDKKVQCVIDEYEKMPFRYRLNGTLTLDENISDFVGIDVAYETYLKYIKKYGAEKKIPGVPLTPEQIFWVQTGTFLCFRKLDDNVVDYEEADEHAIPQFRVQAGARQSKYFAKDFNCPEGSFMNPKTKCTVL
ncbi:hypothetical protein WA026_007730 [Henosepilachna vigintioctopunctata]|uniref:Uncharacterized protein n=1 Tax=Henosepilachna vigintioctopunctata TaxID=420089 RepID=A0AAW1TYJ2_9CUCU